MIATNPQTQAEARRQIDTIFPLIMLRGYESGTFAPVLTPAGGAVSQATTGNHTRWAGLVRFHVRATLSAISSPTGDLTITGLPYSATTRAGPFAVRADSVTLTAGYSWLTARVAAGGSALILEQHGTGVATIALPGTALSAASVIEVAGSYDADQPSGSIIEPTPVGGSGAPVDASFVVMGANATLTDERVLTPGTDVTLTDGGAGGNATVGLSSNVPRIASANVFTAMQSARITDAVTNAATTALTLGHESSGTPAGNFGVALDWNLETTTTANQPAARDVADWVSATHGSQGGRRAIEVYQRGAMRSRLIVGGVTSASVSVPWISGDVASVTMLVGESSATATAIEARSDAGRGVIGISGSSAGVRAASTSSHGLEAISGTGLPLYARQNGGTGTTDVQELGRFERQQASGTPGTGYGGSLTMRLPTSTLVAAQAARLAAQWVDATNATYTSELRISLAESTVTTEVARLDTADSATQTGLLLLHDGTLKRVEVGATDSGGAGYRALRVAN